MRHRLISGAAAAIGIAAVAAAAGALLLVGGQSARAGAAPVLDTADSVSDSAVALQGKAAPDFTLPDQNDQPRHLTDSKGKWVVLAFYPADMTSGCTLQNRSYTAHADEFAARGAVVYTVSTQDTKSKRAFCEKEGLKHTLLSDVGGKVAGAYGVLMPGREIARRVTFYIAPDGTIAGVDTEIHVARAAEDSLAMLDKLGNDSKTPEADPETVAINAAVADFRLPNVATSAEQSLSELSNGKKATVLLFVSTQCPVSNSYNSRMAQLAARYADKGVAFVGINSNRGENSAAVAAHARENRLQFPILKDADNKIADRFHAQVTPEVYVTNANGVLVYHGAIDDSQNPDKVGDRHLATALDAVLRGENPPAPTTRAFGCAIKRASN